MESAAALIALVALLGVVVYQFTKSNKLDD